MEIQESSVPQTLEGDFKEGVGMSQVIQGLRLRTPSVGGPGSTSGQEVRSHMPWDN